MVRGVGVVVRVWGAGWDWWGQCRDWRFRRGRSRLSWSSRRLRALSSRPQVETLASPAFAVRVEDSGKAGDG